VGSAGRFGLRIEEHEIGNRAVGDEGLAPVDEITVVLFHGPGAHPHRVGAGVGFGDAEAADVLAAACPGEDLHLLLFGRIPAEVVEAERLAGADAHRQRVAHPGDRFVNQQGFHVAEARAAVFLFEHDAVDADFPELPEEVGRHPILLVELLHLRFEPGRGPAQDDFLNHFLFRRKFEVEGHRPFSLIDGSFLKYSTENVQKERGRRKRGRSGRCPGHFRGCKMGPTSCINQRKKTTGLSSAFAGLRRGWLPETEGTEMAETDKQDALLREIQTRLDRKLRENELAFLEYWKEQLDAVTARKPEGVAALQTQVRKISEMMANRIRTLKRG